ncbi:methyl-accepting chemotaxis protein [Lysinibacillus xylanilyticus]|uniref:methyl-accepting chemotaxis protein n=1 Tax=Lysinibacillus xylanilyticus TaxID=582475 RepID=UPI003CFCF635
MNIFSNSNISNQTLNETSILSALKSNLSVITFNLKREVIWVNELFANTLGYTVNEIKHMQHKQFCSAEFTNSKEYEELWSDFEKGKKFQGKIKRIGKTGNSFWLEATYIPLLNEDEQVYAVFKIATDITERENNTAKIISQLKDMSLELVNLVIENSNEKIQAIESLKKQTDLITEITKSIRNISMQTNVLALNAAIEAARVGKQGQGFKIVADEVRKLASNVDNAINDVNTNVKNIVDEVVTVNKITEDLQKIVSESQLNFVKTIQDFGDISK